MNSLIDNLAAKIIAIFLLTCFFAIAFISCGGILVSIDEGFYDMTEYDFYSSYSCNKLNYQNAEKAFNNYFLLYKNANDTALDQMSIKKNAEYFDPENSNFLFTIIDENNKIVFSTYENQDYGQYEVFDFEDTTNNANEKYEVITYIQKPLIPGDDYYTTAENLSKLFAWRYNLIIICTISGLLSLAMLIYLLCAAGHKRGIPGISLNYQDRIPYDVFFAIIILALLLPAYFISSEFNETIDLIWVCPFSVLIMLLVLDLLLTTATRIKSGNLLKNTVSFLVLRMCWKLFIVICKKLWGIITSTFSGIGTIIESLPILWKTLLAMGGYLFLNIIFIIGMETSYNGLWLLTFLLFNTSAIIMLCKIILQFREIKDAGTKIASGNINIHINTEKMYRDLKFHGENLNNISVGMAKAVESKMKSERLKTELITNVSHDIKTPLTSIINYVDLLKKEDIQSPKAIEYLEVLERQSSKLKKLTEDLVEASKASTGNINVNLQRTNIAELLNQTVAEYQEKFDAAKLTPMVNINCNHPYILADGRLLWRVFDNLLSNVCKYSQENTRVYFNVNESMGNIIISLKNISRDPLNISTDELMERFVRGDSSRATEGSGLGLSIANSLTDLQNGNFSLQIDGDLFKAQICFAQEKH